MTGSWHNNTQRAQQTPAKPFSEQLPLTPATSSTSTSAKQDITPDLPVDYRLLLLSLADQYINQARAMSNHLVQEQPEVTRDQYYKLMAAAFSCYETVLSKPWGHTIKPREEALVQLRYATCLYEETDNDHEIEKILSKGIPFCQRNRLLDLKYSMQHLQVRTIFNTKSKAAFKYLDTVISEAVTCEHTVWVYALRFLRISLSLSNSSAQDLQAVLIQTNLIVDPAKRQGDRVVSAMACVVHACVQLRIMNAESMVETQQALAIARSMLMSVPNSPCPRLEDLISMLDVACSLDPAENARRDKLKYMQGLLDNAEDTDDDNDDGSFLITIDKTNDGNLTHDTGGLFVKDARGRNNLRFNFLTRDDTFSLGFLLGAMANYPGKKTTPLLCKNALDLMSGTSTPDQTGFIGSLRQSCDRTSFHAVIRSYCLIYMILVRCDSAHLEQAVQTLEALRKSVVQLGKQPSHPLCLFTIYLNGLVAQSFGDFPTAIKHYSNSLLVIPEPNARKTDHVQLVLSVLAGVNRVFIDRQYQSEPSQDVESIMSKLSSHFEYREKSASPVANNAHLISAYHLARGLITKPHLDRNKQLKVSIHFARDKNIQLLMLSMHYLYEFKFKGIMEEASERSAQAALKFAKDCESSTWGCVANGMLSDAFELNGHREDAETCRAKALELLDSLPPALWLAVEGKEDTPMGGVDELGA